MMCKNPSRFKINFLFFLSFFLSEWPIYYQNFTSCIQNVSSEIASVFQSVLENDPRTKKETNGRFGRCDDSNVRIQGRFPISPFRRHFAQHRANLPHWNFSELTLEATWFSSGNEDNSVKSVRTPYQQIALNRYHTVCFHRLLKFYVKITIFCGVLRFKG